MAQRGRQRLLVIVARLSREGDEVQARSAERSETRVAETWRGLGGFSRGCCEVQSDSERVMDIPSHRVETAQLPARAVDAGLLGA
jgi:hypothetical protein